MIKGIYHSAAGMLPRLTQQEVVANNLANVNTTGFKGNRRFFRRILDSTMIQTGLNGEPGMLTELEESLFTDFSGGAFQETRNPLDLAIHGDGFFVLQTGENEDQVSYTRNGNFSLNAEGELVNGRDYRVMGEGGAIRITGDNVVIQNDGSVVVDGEVVDTLKIVDFDKPYKLLRNGYGYFTPAGGAEGDTPEKLDVKQGFLESSNVVAVLEMVRMIELNRNYESCQKAIIAQDETLRRAVNDIAK